MQDNLTTLKVIVVGDQNVGKTHIITQFCIGQIPSNIKSTLGVDFQTKVIRDNLSGESAKLLIYDTAGEEKFHAIAALHYKKAKGCVIVYDVTNRKSFENVERWLNDARNLADQDCIIMLLGNKCDTDDKTLLNQSGQGRQLMNEREVSFEEGASFANINNLSFFEVSAIQKINIKESFGMLGSQIIQLNQSLLLAKGIKGGNKQESAKKPIRLQRSRFECCIQDGREKIDEDYEPKSRCC
ncbi:gtp-binding protein [Stylonychia lemnae]|uniref:Gtp-binding protein n=1 Tax=Stylonychia lemnae TaxID=5949 RepID=A0A077ZRY8_STYLE|nr:gtp-binding protein [Stylonychia lemnae]|eukprot:CDW72647.1 gtp-binding protein [Stylonychia lemnae]